MKFNSVNKNLCDKIKKHVLPITTALTLMASGLTGCKQNKSESTETTTTTTSITTTTDTTDITLDNILGDKETLPSNTYSYTKEMWTIFYKSTWASIKDKVNNVNEESFASALTILNIDFLRGNNPDLLIDFCNKGIDIEAELSNMYMLLSQIREYNTNINSSADYYSFDNLLLSNKDVEVIKILEEDAKTILDLKQKEVSDDDMVKISNIFNKIKSFSLGEKAIDIKNSKVYQKDLSKGGIIVSENIMQTMSVYLQNIISEDERKILDDSLKMKDSLSEINVLLSTYNGISSVLNSSDNEKIVNDMVDKITNNQKIIYEELSKFIDITEDEVNALYIIANIDYFMDNHNSNKVFDVLFKDGIDINKIFNDAESAVMKIELYNMGQDDISKLYNYGHFYLDSEINIISTRAIVNMCYNLHSNDDEIVASNYNSLKGYTQYSSLVTINYNKDGQTVKLDKNSLNKGGNQVIDWITYYGFINNKSNINNESINDIISLVDGTTAGFSPYSEIVLMVEGYCKDNNIGVYDYTVGGKVLTLK